MMFLLVAKNSMNVNRSLGSISRSPTVLLFKVLSICFKKEIIYSNGFTILHNFRNLIHVFYYLIAFCKVMNDVLFHDFDILFFHFR